MSDEGGDARSPGGDPAGTTSRLSINRRRALLAGGAAAAIGAPAMLATRRWRAGPVGAEYDEIVVDRGESHEVLLGDGDRFENKLIDVTADGASVLIATSEGGRNPDNTLNGASDWVIRNVGIRGVPADPADSWSYLFWIGETDPNTTSIFENIFFDGRQPVANGDDPAYVGWRGGGANTDGNHRGHIEAHNNFFAGCGDNANYFESGEAGGTIGWRNCYHRDNTVSSFRTVLSGSRVTDSVAVVNDPDGTRGAYPWLPGNSHLARVLWNRGGSDIGMDNVHVYIDPDDVQPTYPVRTATSVRNDPPEVDIRDCVINGEWVDHRGGNPEWAIANHGDPGRMNVTGLTVDGHDIEVLGDGVPYTPEMAARGERGIPPDWREPAPGGGVPGPGSNVDSG